MNYREELLLKIYKLGFNDELDNNPSDFLILRAYQLGKVDAIIGDDNSNIDQQTDEEILKNIFQKEKDGTV